LENERGIKRFLSRFFPRAQDVDDLAQETFLRAFAAEAERDVLSPRAFLYRIAKNLALNVFGVSTFETVWGFRLEEGFGLIVVT